MIRVAQEILAIHPSNRRALTFAADAYEAKGAVDDLVRVLRLTAASDSTNRAVRLRLARVLANAGRYYGLGKIWQRLEFVKERRPARCHRVHTSF